MSEPVKMWRYVLPPEKGEGWGIFLLDSTGYFSAVSDFGNYAFLWRAHGRNDFREFVRDSLGRDWDYAATKLGTYEQNHRFDPERTVKRVKQDVLEDRRERRLDAEAARYEWDNATDLANGNISPEQWHERSNCEDASEYACYRRDADIEAFCKQLLPRLAVVVRAELASEVEKAHV